MANLPTKGEKEDFGQASGSPVISPLSYQNTFDKGVDSLHDVRPEAEYYEPPMDPINLVPDGRKK